jgi:hypothetical protein
LDDDKQFSTDTNGNPIFKFLIAHNNSDVILVTSIFFAIKKMFESSLGYL